MICDLFWKQKIVKRGPGLVKKEDVFKRLPSLTPKSRSRGVPCEQVILSFKSQVFLQVFFSGGSCFCSTSSVLLGQRFYRTLLCLLCLWH